VNPKNGAYESFPCFVFFLKKRKREKPIIFGFLFSDKNKRNTQKGKYTDLCTPF